MKRAGNFALRRRTLLLGIVATLLLLDRQGAGRTPVRPNDDETEQQGQGDRLHTGPGDNCWCHPTLVFDGEGVYSDVWIHKGFGEELAPSRVIAAAIAEAMRQEEE